jgi:hypothetical protein
MSLLPSTALKIVGQIEGNEQSPRSLKIVASVRSLNKESSCPVLTWQELSLFSLKISNCFLMSLQKFHCPLNDSMWRLALPCLGVFPRRRLFHEVRQTTQTAWKSRTFDPIMSCYGALTAIPHCCSNISLVCSVSPLSSSLCGGDASAACVWK